MMLTLGNILSNELRQYKVNFKNELDESSMTKPIRAEYKLN